jgi:hypothetical protein
MPASKSLLATTPATAHRAEAAAIAGIAARLAPAGREIPAEGGTGRE